MPRLWLRMLPAVALTCAIFGCSGQKLEGRWRGPFPLEDAKACVLNLYNGHHFDLACDGHVWVGEGRYESTSSNLRMTFSTLFHRDERLRQLPDLDMPYEGRGNEIVLKVANQQSFTLSRHL